MTSPLISIITVCYNAENSIEKTIHSVLNQTFINFEYLIIDGKSNDQTLNIIKTFDSPLIKVTSEPDNGIYDAMNKGVSIAKGKFITFLNAGDYYFDNQTLKFVSKAIIDDYKFIYGDYITYRDLNNVVVKSPKISTTILRKYFRFCHQTIFVDKTLSGYYDLNYKIKADYKWVLDIIKKLNPEKITKLKRPIVYYQLDGFSNNAFITNLFELIKLHYNEFGLLQVIQNLRIYSIRLLRHLRYKILNH